MVKIVTRKRPRRVFASRIPKVSHGRQLWVTRKLIQLGPMVRIYILKTKLSV